MQSKYLYIRWLNCLDVDIFKKSELVCIMIRPRAKYLNCIQLVNINIDNGHHLLICAIVY